MKVVNINARIDIAGKHNDRNFDLKNAPHIDPEKVKDNIYWTYNGSSKHLDEVEQMFYEEHFTNAIEAQNEKNFKNNHRSRNKTVEQYRKGKNTRPEDKILQIGDMHEHVSGELLWECAQEYRRQFEERYGDHCKIIDMALHMDEVTPHVHIRRVWVAQNEDGLEIVSQTKALEQMGIREPKTNKPVSKNNNAKMTIDNTDKALFHKICIDKGIDVEPLPTVSIKQKHRSVEEYKEMIREKELELYEKHLNGINNKIAFFEEADKNDGDAKDWLEQKNNEMFDFFAINELIAFEYKSLLEKAYAAEKESELKCYLILREAYEEELAKILNNAEKEDIDKSKELEKAMLFIKKKGLLDEYRQEKNISIR